MLFITVASPSLTMTYDTIRHGLQKLLILSYDLGRVEIRILYYINIIILLNVIILSLIYCVKWL